MSDPSDALRKIEEAHSGYDVWGVQCCSRCVHECPCDILKLARALEESITQEHRAERVRRWKRVLEEVAGE